MVLQATQGSSKNQRVGRVWQVSFLAAGPISHYKKGRLSSLGLVRLVMHWAEASPVVS